MAKTAPHGLKDVRCLVVNLDRRPDRWDNLCAHMKKEAPWLLERMTRFRASDGANDDIPEDKVTSKWNTKRNAQYGDYEGDPKFLNPGVWYKMSPGERGCAMSHVRLWEEAAKGDGPLFVLEDDATLNFERTGGMGKMNGKKFTKRLDAIMKNLPKDIDVLYLGWSGYREGNLNHWKPQNEGNDYVKAAEYVWTTIAYLIWPAGAKKLLAKGACDQPVDNFMAWEAASRGIRSFVALDEGDGDDDWAGGLIDQLDFFGDSDILKSDGGATNDDNTSCLIEQPTSSSPKPEKPAKKASPKPSEKKAKTAAKAPASSKKSPKKSSAKSPKKAASRKSAGKAPSPKSAKPSKKTTASAAPKAKKQAK